MAKLTIIGNGGQVGIDLLQGITRNPDGTYEVAQTGGTISVYAAKPKAGTRGWQCDCEIPNEAGNPEDVNSVFYYYMGNKIIIRNPTQRELHIIDGRNTSTGKGKIMEIYPVSPILKIIDTATKCFICVSKVFESNGDTSVPTAELICHPTNGHWLKVTNKTQRNVRVILNNATGVTIYQESFSYDNYGFAGVGIARGFMYIDGIGEVPITVPFCKAPPKD